MPFVRAKSKRDISQCMYEANGARCQNTYKQGDDYVYDTDQNKGYCTQHNEINEKTQASSTAKGAGARGYGTPLRSPEDMVNITANFDRTILPMAVQAHAKHEQISLRDWITIYTEVYLGKFNIGPSDNNSNNN